VHSEDEPPLVVLPGTSAAPPFIFVHGDVRGGGWYCRTLAQLIGSEMPMIVLPTLRPTGPQDPRTVEAMAAIHVAEVRKVQPHGPYRLGGYCFGGVIAFEMAQQLRDQGEVVERLVLVDTSLRNAPLLRWRSLVDLVLPAGPRSAALQRRADWLGRVGALRRKSSAERWEWVRRNVAKRLPGGQRAAGTSGSEEPKQTGEIWTRPGTDVIRFEARGAGAYVPRSYDGPIDLVVAVEKAEVADVAYAATMGTEPSQRTARVGRRGWQFVTTDVRVHPVQATHVGLITSALETLAGVLRRLLVIDMQNSNERSHE
jgi:thioesterase domain-containing protein